MRSKRRLLTLVLPMGLLLTAGQGPAWAAGEPSPPATQGTDTSAKRVGVDTTHPDTDNTRRNVRDRSDTAVTPENQKENASDRGITAAIRRALVADDSLSTNAHNNVKIITRDQNVTLRGVVDSAAEKAKVAEYAHQAAGVKRVDNHLEINKR